MYNIVMARYDSVQYYFKIIDKMVGIDIKRRHMIFHGLESITKLKNCPCFHDLEMLIGC